MGQDMLWLKCSWFFNSSSSPHKSLIHCPDDGCIPPNTKPHDIAKPGRYELPIWILSGFFIAFRWRYLNSSSLPRPAEFWQSVFSPFYWESLREASEPGASEWAVFMPSSRSRIKTMTHNNALVSLLLITKATWLSLVHVQKPLLLIHRLELTTVSVSTDGIVRKDTEVCNKFDGIWASMVITNGIIT